MTYLRNWEFKLSKEAKRELAFLAKSNKPTLLKIHLLFKSIATNPRSGIGKPERLKHRQIETWSRKVDKKNRIQYRVVENIIIIISCIGHYDD
ncbi:MAG: Txe/YoeB family addiction module toxin [Christensenellaceae bacterium]|jgi:toxin YoeB|nr:Txe/YoeB family addiction module toxin [Christensenellaceae bacterium]